MYVFRMQFGLCLSLSLKFATHNQTFVSRTIYSLENKIGIFFGECDTRDIIVLLRLTCRCWVEHIYIFSSTRCCSNLGNEMSFFVVMNSLWSAHSHSQLRYRQKQTKTEFKINFQVISMSADVYVAAELICRWPENILSIFYFGFGALALSLFLFLSH